MLTPIPIPLCAWLTLLAQAVPNRSALTFLELLVGAMITDMITDRGFVTEALLAITPRLRHRGPSRHHAAAKVAHLFQMARRGKVVLDCRRATPLQDPRHPLRAAGLVSGHRR